MVKEWDIVEVLRHSRHDWLNRLQLIKGNLDLDRIDRAKAYIDEIVMEVQNESNLSNCHLPMFASLLLKTNWENYSFQLEYEVIHDNEPLKINDSSLTNWTQAFFVSLNQAVEAFQDNHLSITIETQEEGVRFFFDFSGIIIKNELIEQFLTDKRTPEMAVEVKEFSKSELALEAFIPFS